MKNLLPLIIPFFFIACHQEEYSQKPLPHHAYVWKRQWTPSLVEQMRKGEEAFQSYSILAGEISWKKNQAKLSTINYADQELPKSVKSLSLRINTYPGTFEKNPQNITDILQIFQHLLDKAKKQNLTINEIQIDYDSPSSKLADYSYLIQNIKKAFPKYQITITSLPSWMNHPDCKKLFKTCDSFVLQVHSLVLPKSPTEIEPLFDLYKTRKWLKQAATFDRDFHLALPTYGYYLGFDLKGKYLGVAAEQGPKNWPRIRIIFPNADETATLIKQLKTRHPKRLKSIIWYRLGDQEDRLVWSLNSFKALINGTANSSSLKVLSHKTKEGLIEIRAINQSDFPVVLPRKIDLLLKNNSFLFAEALQNYQINLDNNKHFSLSTNGADNFIPANSTITLSWLRLNNSTPAEISINAKN